MDTLTSKNFWIKYWESHKGEIIKPVAESYIFDNVFEEIFSKGNIRTTCEVGGFPGTFSIYLRKKYKTNPTLIDYVIIEEFVHEFLEVNKLEKTDLEMIEADIFNHKTTTKYDLVFSIGLIEHFNDTENIVKRHIDLIEDKGKLLIIIPNFRGLNGWFQKKFDIENYKIHNIKSMDIDLLESIAEKNNLKNIRSYYYGNFGLWLERENEKALLVRILKKVFWVAGKVFFKVFKFNSKSFSPYIILEGNL